MGENLIFKMKKFKIGDKVRCINHRHSRLLDLNHIYFVVSGKHEYGHDVIIVSKTLNGHPITNQLGWEISFYVERFELVEENKGNINWMI